MAELVAKTYAEALFEVAVEIQQLDQFGEQLRFVSDTFQQYPEFYELYKTPQISNEEKKSIIANVFQKGVQVELLNFLKILIDKRRTGKFEDIAKEYQRLVNDYHNIVEAVAITTKPLGDADRLNLESKLAAMTGKKIKLKNEIDPTIIGGMLVRMGDKVIDGTVQSRLGKLKESLAQIIV